MRIVPLLLVALIVGAIASVSTARACGPLGKQLTTAGSGTVRWTWGAADAPAVNLNFAGPGTYTQTISVTGVSGTFSQLDFGAEVLGEYPAAWSMLFVPPYLNCVGQPGLSFAAGAVGTESIPGAAVSFMSQMPVCWPSTLQIVVTATFDPPFTFDPAKRYGIATLSYDHSASVTGPGDATHCGGAEVGLCFKLASTLGTMESPALTWQGGTCTGPTPARTSTWGALKQAYR